MSTAYSAAVEALQKHGQGKLVQHLGKHVGHGIGLELRESSNLLNAKNTRRVRPGMVFTVTIGVQVRIVDPPPSDCLALLSFMEPF